MKEEKHVDSEWGFGFWFLFFFVFLLLKSNLLSLSLILSHFSKFFRLTFWHFLWGDLMCTSMRIRWNFGAILLQLDHYFVLFFS